MTDLELVTYRLKLFASAEVRARVPDLMRTFVEQGASGSTQSSTTAPEGTFVDPQISFRRSGQLGVVKEAAHRYGFVVLDLRPISASGDEGTDSAAPVWSGPDRLDLSDIETLGSDDPRPDATGLAGVARLPDRRRRVDQLRFGALERQPVP